MISFLKVLAVFILIIVLIARRWNIGLIMLAGSFILSLLFSMGVWPWIVMAFHTCIDFATLNLVGSLILIQFLEGTLRRTGLLESMVGALKRLISDHRLVMSFLPAFLGFLPSAGGAVFSAPLVAEASKDYELTAEKRSFINYWFRHIWEYVFPLYPGLILASALLVIPVQNIIFHQAPLTLVAVIAGAIIAFPGLKMRRAPIERRKKRWRDLLDLFLAILPVLTVLVLVLAFHLDLLYSLTGVLLAMFLWAALTQKWKPANFWQLIVKSFSLNTVFLVFGVMIFKDTLLNSGAVNELSAFFHSTQVPSLFLASFLPFLVGVLTGVTQAFVAVAFPLLLNIYGTPVNLSLVALSYACGFAGVLISPVHLCLVLTREYFKAEWGKLYRLLLPAALSIIVAGFALKFIW